MVKRVNTMRKSAILEHLLDLERQIRSELARASIRRQSDAQTGGRAPQSSRRDGSPAGGSDGGISPEIARRYLH
jgi:hypothetical protein